MSAPLVQTSEGGPLLSEEALRDFETRYGFTLPAAYRDFLLATNGGRPERDLFAINGLEGNPRGRIHVFFGLKDPVVSCNLDWNLEVFKGRIPEGLLPIATTEGADKVCLSVAGAEVGAIFYWDAHASDGSCSLLFLAEDFAAFVSSLQADDLSPRILKA